MRFIVLVLLVVLAVWLIRRAFKASTKSESLRQRAGEVGDLVRCARCGVHLPRAEAHLAGGLTYCGEEHARLGAGGS
jgi:uncharacterized protein